ncbi:MAG: DUF423 domain-containing protein [Ferruginibacter sp.]
MSTAFHPSSLYDLTVMHNGFLKAAALLGIISVALGAFSAHSLKGMVSEHAVATFETAVRYQFYHVFALMITGIIFKDVKFKTVIWAGWFFIAGIILFSGSLYALSMVQAAVRPGYKWIGPITPIGGLCFIIGWLLLFISFFKKN